ncbi:MAG: hypothetical protein CL840_14925 [Crocinitomicaceae bacterium]|jgi:hypothetical protein|nr:hypothetical protein [Crocinitomicaceae bacterium]|tara:strand:+ start:145932 stop:146198 length:267 start_codon:yes stop_codon:yes gene_type:complete
MKQSISQYLEALITEKGRDIDADLNKPGHIGLTYRNLIEFIENEAAEHDQATIRKNLVAMDFANADVFHFLDHLVDGMIKAQNLDAFA